MSGSAGRPRAGPSTLEATLSAFADRVFRTGGRDPGDGVLPIPAARLGIYRDLVLGGARSMMTFAYSETLRLLDFELAARPSASGDVGRDDVLRRFLATSPPTTHSTREQADRFAEFLVAAYPDVVARRPELPDLLRIERAELRAAYHEDDPGREVGDGDLEGLRAASVEEFLATRVLRAPSGSVLALTFPAFEVRAALERREFPPSPAPCAETVVVGRRPRTLQPALAVVAAPGASALGLVPLGEPTDLETVAMRWTAELPERDAAAGDAALFASFADAVLVGFSTGLLRLP